MKKVFRNKAYTIRNYECTNVVACVAEQAPNSNWEEADESILDNLSSLGGITTKGVTIYYYGHL